MSQFEDLQACYLKLRKHASQDGPHTNGRTPNGHGPDTLKTGILVSMVLHSNATACLAHVCSSVWPCSQKLLIARLQRPCSTEWPSGEQNWVWQIQETRRHMTLAWPTEAPRGLS